MFGKMVLEKCDCWIFAFVAHWQCVDYGIKSGIRVIIRLYQSHSVKCQMLSDRINIKDKIQSSTLLLPNHFELRLDAITLRQPELYLSQGVVCVQTFKQRLKNRNTMKILTIQIIKAFEYLIKMRICCHVTYSSARFGSASPSQ